MKGKIVSILKENKNKFISGERISSDLNISRSAVWKHMNKLKEEGYKIQSIPRKGYSLLDSPDILTLEEIAPYLNTKFIGKRFYHYESLISTNITAKELALEEKEGSLVISEEQKGGKGRLGRGWVSPKSKGIWLSIVLKPQIEPWEAAKITLIGGAAVYLALREIGIKSQIKWPNDILVEGKKVAGILTEMTSELNMVNYIIIGIGINVNLDREDFREQLSEKATSLKIYKGKLIDRKKLTADILNYFEKFYILFKEKKDISKAIDISRKNSILIGKEVRIIKGGMERLAKVLDIDNEGQLIISNQDGEIEKVFSGEVSVRGLRAYI